MTSLPDIVPRFTPATLALTAKLLLLSKRKDAQVHSAHLLDGHGPGALILFGGSPKGHQLVGVNGISSDLRAEVIPMMQDQTVRLGETIL